MLEDPFFGEVSFHADRQQELVPFAQRIPGGAQENILNGLLGNRTAAVDQALFGQVVFHRFLKGFNVDSFMFVKTGVLGDDHGPNHALRY